MKTINIPPSAIPLNLKHKKQRKLHQSSEKENFFKQVIKRKSYKQPKKKRRNKEKKRYII